MWVETVIKQLCPLDMHFFLLSCNVPVALLGFLVTSFFSFLFTFEVVMPGERDDKIIYVN